MNETAESMAPEFLRAQKVNRSAYAETTARPTAIYLGTCEEHQRPVRYDTTQEGRWGHEERSMIPCPVTGHMIKGERLVAVTTTLDCDGSCRSARKASCSCGCGGVNHGNTWTAGKLLSNAEVVASELVKYRAEIRNVEQKREQRREQAARRERVTFDAWAADHQDVIQALAAYRHSEDSSTFLHDLAVQVSDGWNGKPKPLSENQEFAALRTIADISLREKAEEQRKAAARPAPEGRSEISGQIVKISVRDGYAGRIEYKATVRCDGFAVWVTLPRAVESWVTANRRKELWDGWKPSHGTDYQGASDRWTSILRGFQISFTADVSRSERDESFGFAKRPIKVSFASPETDREAGS
jgi:hypothetical protein